MVVDAKAKKNAVCKAYLALSKPDRLQTEIEGFRQCHLRDGTALVRYFAWLEEVLHKGEKWTEYDAAEVLENYRRFVIPNNNKLNISDLEALPGRTSCSWVYHSRRSPLLGQMGVSPYSISRT